MTKMVIVTVTMLIMVMMMMMVVVVVIVMMLMTTVMAMTTTMMMVDKCTKLFIILSWTRVRSSWKLFIYATLDKCMKPLEALCICYLGQLYEALGSSLSILMKLLEALYLYCLVYWGQGSWGGVGTLGRVELCVGNNILRLFSEIYCCF